MTYPSKPTPPADHLVSQELERQLADTQTALAKAREDHAEASFAVVTNASQDTKLVATLAGQITELGEKVSMLVAARSVARKRDAERLSALRLAGQRNRVERVGQLLKRRTAYGAELTELLTKAARTFRLLSENSEKVGILSGVNAKSGKLSDAAIRELVANEIYRLAPGSLGRLGPTDYGRFPGAEPASPDVRLNPYATPPLVDRLKEADAYVTRELTRLISEDQLSPVAMASLDALGATDPVEAPEPPGATPAPALPVSGETGLPLEPFNLKAHVAANPPTPARLPLSIRGH